MKIYIVSGFGLDPVESGMEIYSKVFKDRSIAEKYITDVMEEQISFVHSWLYYGIVYYDTKVSRNGSLKSWEVKVTYDLKKPKQKEAFLNSTLVISGGIDNDEFHPVLNECERPEFRTMTSAFMSIKEEEI